LTPPPIVHFYARDRISHYVRQIWKDVQMDSFQDAVKRFEASADWLGDADLPALVTLRRIADELDGGNMSPALISQFGLTFRDLRKRQSSGDGDGDALEAALQSAAKD